MLGSRLRNNASSSVDILSIPRIKVAKTALACDISRFLPLAVKTPLEILNLLQIISTRSAN